jgi:hypothetical protein
MYLLASPFLSQQMTPVLQAVELQARLIRAQHDARQLRQVNAFLRARGEMCDVRMQALMASSTGLALSALPDAARALVEAESASSAGSQSLLAGASNQGNHSAGSGSSNSSSAMDDALLSVDALVEREMAACWLPALTARDANAVEARNANVARLIDRLAAALTRMTTSGANGTNGASGALNTVSSALPQSSSSSSSSFGSDAGSADDDTSAASAFEPALCAADATALRSAFWELVGDDGVQRHRLARARQLLRRQHAQVAHTYHSYSSIGVTRQIN